LKNKSDRLTMDIQIPSYQIVALTGSGKTTALRNIAAIGDLARENPDESQFITALNASYPMFSEALTAGEVTLEELRFLEHVAVYDNTWIQNPGRFEDVVTEYNAANYYGADGIAKIPQDVRRPIDAAVRKDLAEMPATAAKTYLENHGKLPAAILTAAVAMSGYAKQVGGNGETIFEERCQVANKASPEGSLTAPTHIILLETSLTFEEERERLTERHEKRPAGQEKAFYAVGIENLNNEGRVQAYYDEVDYFNTNPLGVQCVVAPWDLTNSEDPEVRGPIEAKNAIEIIHILNNSHQPCV
jgi:hypothetical protein